MGSFWLVYALARGRLDTKEEESDSKLQMELQWMSYGDFIRWRPMV